MASGQGGAARPTGSGVGASTPQRGGTDARSQVEPGTCSTVTRQRESADDVLGPQGPRGRQTVHDVVDAGVRVLGEQLDDRIGDIGGIGRGPPLVADDPQRPRRRPRPASAASRILRGKSRPRRPEQPGGPRRCRAGRPDVPAASNASVAARSPPSLDAPYGLPGDVGSSGRVADAVVASPVEDLVGRDRDEVDPARRAGGGQDPVCATPFRRRAQVRVACAAIDVGPGRGVDDDLGPVAVEPRADGVGRVEVERATGPRRVGPAGPVNGASAGRSRARRPSRPVAPGHGDAHQGAVRSRAPYWRS